MDHNHISNYPIAHFLYRQDRPKKRIRNANYGWFYKNYDIFFTFSDDDFDIVMLIENL